MNKILSLSFALFVAAGSAHAGSVQLTVTDKDGKPAPDVVVLVQAAQAQAASAPAPTPSAKPAPRAPAPKPVVITQENSRFVPFLTVVPVGTTLRFINKDGYDHHVRSTPSGPLGSIAPVKSFELRLDANMVAAATSTDPYQSGAAKKASGTSTEDVKVDKAGPIGLGCHIHGSMRGQIYVADTPFFAKTDTNGVAVIDNLPDGNTSITLWHADQLQEQSAVPVEVSATPTKAAAKLNFTPARRRG